MAIICLQKGSGKMSRVREKSGNFDTDNEWQPCFKLLPFFEFCTLQFCKCDISESIIGRGSKLLSACRVQ